MAFRGSGDRGGGHPEAQCPLTPLLRRGGFWILFLKNLFRNSNVGIILSTICSVGRPPANDNNRWSRGVTDAYQRPQDDFHSAGKCDLNPLWLKGGGPPQRGFCPSPGKAMIGRLTSPLDCPTQKWV